MTRIGPTVRLCWRPGEPAGTAWGFVGPDGAIRLKGGPDGYPTRHAAELACERLGLVVELTGVLRWRRVGTRWGVEA